MPVDNKRILAFLKKPGYSPMRRRELARAMRVSDDDYPEFRVRLDWLVRTCRIALGRGKRYVAAAEAGLVTGRINTVDGRYGFVQNSLLNLPVMSDGSVTVVDLRTQKVVRSMNTLKENGLNPNLIVLLPEWNDLAGH